MSGQEGMIVRWLRLPEDKALTRRPPRVWKDPPRQPPHEESVCQENAVELFLETRAEKSNILYSKMILTSNDVPAAF